MIKKKINNEETYKKNIVFKWNKITEKYKMYKNAIQKPISIRINTLLPENIRINIYLFAIKKYLREYIPPYSRISLWNPFKHNVMKELFKSNYQNVHFMHLSFNTLPENKQWIMGCQCDYCKNYDIHEKKKHYERQLNDCTYFNTMVPYTTFEWNDYICYTNEYKRIIFDPLYEIKGDIKKQYLLTYYDDY